MKVFVIDDEEISIFLISNMLVIEGVAAKENIISFLSAELALQTLLASSEEELPNIILLDLAMPETDGWQFLDRLTPLQSRLANRCSIYILTSSIIQSDKDRAKKNPMITGFIHKPITKEDLRTLRTTNGL